MRNHNSTARALTLKKEQARKAKLEKLYPTKTKKDGKAS